MAVSAPSSARDIQLATGHLHVVERGDGTPIVVLHGGRLDHRHMRDALEPVFAGQAGWRRLYVDMPGHGHSSAPDSVASQDDVLAMLLDLVDVVLPDERFAVIGESRGSYLARGVVHKRPDAVRGMMLIGCGGFTPEAAKHLPEHQTLVRADRLREGLEPGMLGRFDRLVVQNAQILEKIRETKLPAAALNDAALEKRIAARFTFSFDLAAPKAPFPRPCLILSGRQDSIAGYRDANAMLDLYPRATHAILDRAGHSLAWEQPDLLAALTREWLGRMIEN